MAVPIGNRTRGFVPLTAVALALLALGTAPGLSSRYPDAVLAPAIGAPVVTAAAINTTAITVTWTAEAGAANYTLMYARFYGLPIAYIPIPAAKTVYNVTGLGSGLTYYFTVWAWSGGVEGPASNVAAAQTDPLPPVQTPFPWAQLDAITTLSILGSFAISAAIAVFVAGRRSRRAEGVAAVALARTRPRDADREVYRPRPGSRRNG